MSHDLDRGPGGAESGQEKASQVRARKSKVEAPTRDVNLGSLTWRNAEIGG